MCFECLFIWQWCFGGFKAQTFENEFQTAMYYCYLLHVNYKMPFPAQICENSDVVHMNITCSVY